MSKNRLTVGIIAFVGLAALNFTQSESCLVSKALASSGDSYSSSSGNPVESWWDSNVWACKSYTCIKTSTTTVSIGDGVEHTETITTKETATKCAKGNTMAHCWENSFKKTCDPC